MAFPMLLLFEAYKGLLHPLSQFSLIFPRKLAGQRSSCIFTGENTEAQRGEVTCPRFWWTKGTWVIDPSASNSGISLMLHALRELIPGAAFVPSLQHAPLFVMMASAACEIWFKPDIDPHGPHRTISMQS